MAVIIMPKRKGKISRVTFRTAKPLDLSEENWRGIEEAYGRSISQNVRDQTVAATIQFLRLAAAENTPLMEDALKRVTSLRDRAQSLNEAINQLAIGDPIREYVNDQLAGTYALLNYDRAAFPTRNYIAHFSLEIGRFVNTCNETLNFLPQYDYWPTGGAWEIWIRQLTKIFANNNLPTGARKDVNKNKRATPSPFAKFVWSLQSFLPKQYIRAIHSSGALVTAIYEARKGSKPLVALRKTRARKTGGNRTKP
jgi:hypothetical protein